MLQAVSKHLVLLSSAPWPPYVFFKFFQEIGHYDWLHYLQFFVSFDACASSAYVKGLDDIEW